MILWKFENLQRIYGVISPRIHQFFMAINWLVIKARMVHKIGDLTKFNKFYYLLTSNF